MKKVLKVIIISAIACFVLGACSNNSKNGDTEKQVPVYLGMTITGNAPLYSAAQPLQSNNNGNGNNNGNEGNHYGNVKGDTTDKDEDIDQDAPFEEVENPADFEEEMLSLLEVISGDEVYYAVPNQDIYITIRLSNPDSYEILSFTLNGDKYQSYQFQDGSDGQNLILKKNVGNTSGTVEYTIDAIKYVDGTDIKDVLISGDKTVKAGVKTERQVTASISNEQIKLNGITFDITVTDTKSLIAAADGTVRAAIFDGEQIYANKELEVGKKNSVVFDTLKPNTLYQYVIIAYYDNLSGDPAGISLNILAKKAFYTEAIVLFDADAIEVGQEEIKFDFVWDDERTSREIIKTELFLDGVKVKDIEGKTAGNLLSGKEYTVRAIYKNEQNENETIAFTVTTLAKAVPTVTIGNVIPTNYSLEFSITVEDIDLTGEITAVELYKDGGLIEAFADLSDRVFSGLDEFTVYQIRVTYSYNLNDGTDEHTLTAEYSVKTLAKILTIETENLNSSAVSLGENVMLQMTLTNAKAVPISKVKINGAYYTPSGASTPTFLRVTVPIDDSFEGGMTDLVIEAVYYEANGSEYCVLMNENNSASQFINGELFVESIALTDSWYNKPEYLIGTEACFYITLKNRTGYNIDSVAIEGKVYGAESITVIDNNHIAIRIKIYSGWYNYSITSITYSNIYLSKTKNVTAISTQNCYVTETKFVEVRTAEDLKKMEEKCLYILMNDIDLKGIEWVGYPFYGVFEGNNFKIKNMRVVKTFENQDVSLGLFSFAEGIIKNLVIENALFMVTVNSTSGSSYNINAGFLTATSKQLDISNVIVLNCAVDVVNNTSGSTNNDGLVGYNYDMTQIVDSYIKESMFNRIIDIATPEELLTLQGRYLSWFFRLTADIDLGGAKWIPITNNIIVFDGNGFIISNFKITGDYEFAGFFGKNIGVIKNLGLENFTVNITSTTGKITVGGFVGINENGGIIDNCYTKGNVTVVTNNNIYAGGLVGNNKIDGLISNCYATGNVSAMANSDSSSVNVYAGGLVGFNGGATVTKNCYATGNVSGVASTSSSYGASAYSGGLFGRINGTITGCFAIGNVTSTSYAGGLAGAYSGGTITNCYRYIGQTVAGINSGLGTACSLAELDSETFYIDTLGWDGDVWYFTELNFTNGIMPALKNFAELAA